MAWRDPESLSTTGLEEGSDIALDFKRFFSSSGDGVVPVVAQDVESYQLQQAIMEHTYNPGRPNIAALLAEQEAV